MRIETSPEVPVVALESGVLTTRVSVSVSWSRFDLAERISKYSSKTESGDWKKLREGSCRPPNLVVEFEILLVLVLARGVPDGDCVWDVDEEEFVSISIPKLSPNPLYSQLSHSFFMHNELESYLV
jgi:hypothetical protein